jgi:exodeoxyribonuclease V alpha subunit
MVRENSYRHGLYNGDVGIVRDDGDGTGLRVWFDTATGPRAWLPAALPAHESAFALTVHKSQGSEFDDVLLVLPERSVRVLSRELVYTGITRARNALTISANEDVLSDAISRRAQRWSGLAERLCKSGD